MIYPIHVYGMPVLRKKAADIGPEFEGLDQLIADMYDTLYHADGVGLAAPQIGKSIRVIVIDATRPEKDKESELIDFKTVLINPYIIDEKGTEWEFNEGCLSLPDIEGDVWRAKQIRVRYQTLAGESIEREATELEARCIMHEVDHLNGILFIDRMAPDEREKLAGKLARLRKSRPQPVGS